MSHAEEMKALADATNAVVPRRPPEELMDRILLAAKQGEYSIYVEILPPEERAWLIDNRYWLKSPRSFIGKPDPQAVEVCWVLANEMKCK